MAITIDHLSYTYSAGTAYEVQALKDICLTIPDGEFIALIGHTGCGKSTLIQHLNGLLKATGGTICENGRNYYDRDFDMRSLRSRVGLVFQYPEYQLFEDTVLKDVCFGPKNQGLSESEAVEKAKKALHMVKVGEEYYERSPFDLSGGQKRRVAIAGILAMEPSVLVLDEPAAGLDPAGREEMLGLIADLHRKNNITVLFVSHSMEDAANYASRIIVMNHGEIMCDGTPREIFLRWKELEEVGLSAPEVTYILQGLKDKGWDVDVSETTMTGARDSILHALGMKGDAHVS